MQLALMTEPQVGGSYDRLVELARWAEAEGLDAFARSDHYLDQDRSAPVTDALTSLAGLARETTRIQLVVLVTPLTFRHPGVIAKTAATIDEMSGGRFALGVGTGWMAREHEAFGIPLPPLDERFSRLYETLAYLRAAFRGKEGFTGRHYRLAPVDVLPRPTGRLPIIVGGSGMRKTPTFAGRFADEYNMFVTDRETLSRRLEVMREAAADAGRDPDEILVSFAGPAVVAEDPAAYRELLARRAARRNMTPAEYAELLVSRNIPHGAPDQAAATLAGLAAMGVGRYYIQEYRALDEIDTEALGVVVRALRG
ncbi:MAG TPA: LLM class flavin-dependent oxidoreductase [Actinobacteria bacterium]|nr:LLM class flavin-dependent oxidoreductase [Actinomycetota bacterium]